MNLGIDGVKQLQGQRPGRSAARFIKNYSVHHTWEQWLDFKMDQWLVSHETDIYSGCLEHRLSSAFSSQAILYNTISTSSSHFKFNTSSLSKEFRTNDYTIVFQSLFLSTSSRLSLYHLMNIKHASLLLMELDCKFCTQNIIVREIQYEEYPLSYMIQLPATVREKISSKT